MQLEDLCMVRISLYIQSNSYADGDLYWSNPSLTGFIFSFLFLIFLVPFLLFVSLDF